MNKSVKNSIHPTRGLITKASVNSVADTLDKLATLINSKGMKVFARFNHAAEAFSVGLEMHPTEVLIFGDPKTGTPLMNRYQLLAIHLPLKALAWEDENGRVWLAYNSPLYLQKRYSLEETPFQSIGSLIDEAIK